jgi:hypothetical protein
MVDAGANSVRRGNGLSSIRDPRARSRATRHAHFAAFRCARESRSAGGGSPGAIRNATSVTRENSAGTQGNPRCRARTTAMSRCVSRQAAFGKNV